jgi:hypothetical protein
MRVALLAAGITVGAAFVLISVRAIAAAPPQFSLTFEGAHIADPAMPGGLRHDGRFTASAPFCSVGRAYDVKDVSTGAFLDVMRVHTCDDGSGSMTAYMPVVRGEHGGRGAWQIVEGTGQYAKLRGHGTYTGTILTGDPELFDTIVYRTTWEGVADLDADPPTIASFSAKATKLPLRLRTYSLRMAVSAQDSATPISLVVEVTAGSSSVAFKRMSTASGAASFALRIRPPRSARSLRIALTTADALGNTSTASRSVRLR